MSLRTAAGKPNGPTAVAVILLHRVMKTFMSVLSGPERLVPEAGF